MKNLYNKVSLFSVLALVAFEPQNLQATSSSSSSEESQNSQKPVKSLTSQSFNLLEDTLQKMKNNPSYIFGCPSDLFVKITLEEMKQFESKITPDHEMFDSWIELNLLFSPKDFNIEDSLQFVKEKGESKTATSAAQFNLGVMYSKGKGVEQDFTKAFELHTKAADQGYVPAQYGLAAMYHTGQGVEQDLVKAFELYETAADKGNVEAQYILGLIYQKGQDVDQDLTKAFELYEAAANKGYALAQNILGLMYQTGRGADQDSCKAFEYLEKSAYQGNVNAQFHVGCMYLFAQGVDFNLAESLKWCLVSLKNKNIDNNLKIAINRFTNFVPSTIVLEDEKSLQDNQEILKHNIEVFLGLHGMEKGINTLYESIKKGIKLTLSFKEGKFAIPSLALSYQEILDFEGFLLKTIPIFDQCGFMVTCLQPKDVEAFKLSKSSDIKYHELQGQSFLTFGQSNVKAADKLITILDQSHPVYGAISDILSALTEIHKSFQTGIQLNDLAKDLKNQYEFRLKLGSKNQPSDPMKALTRHKALVEKVEQEIEVLKQLQAMPQQLTDLLIEGAPVRNRLFLQKNDYIEPIFKD